MMHFVPLLKTTGTKKKELGHAKRKKKMKPGSGFDVSQGGPICSDGESGKLCRYFFFVGIGIIAVKLMNHKQKETTATAMYFNKTNRNWK